MTPINGITAGLTGLAIAAATFASANHAEAATVSTVNQAVNILASSQQTTAFPSGLTGGAPLTVDVGGPVAVAPGIEFPGFAFGTYDVDVSANSLTMTFVNEIANLAVSNYTAETTDFYYYEFDRAIAWASLTDVSTGFGATVEILSPGSTASSVGAFVPGLQTDFAFDNGGILVSIGDGTNLGTVGQGGSLTVEISAVPVPASLGMLLVALSCAGIFARRRAAA